MYQHWNTVAGHILIFLQILIDVFFKILGFGVSFVLFLLW